MSGCFGPLGTYHSYPVADLVKERQEAYNKSRASKEEKEKPVKRDPKSGAKGKERKIPKNLKRYLGY